MTQVKSNERKLKKQLDLQSKFKSLDPIDQEAVINFFNLHNAAIWIYSSLSSAAKEYTDFSINLSQEKVEDE